MTENRKFGEVSEFASVFSAQNPPPRPAEQPPELQPATETVPEEILTPAYVMRLPGVVTSASTTSTPTKTPKNVEKPVKKTKTGRHARKRIRPILVFLMGLLFGSAVFIPVTLFLTGEL